MEPFVLDNTPEPPKLGPVFEPGDKTTQRVLLCGLDCLPGQMDLFDADGESHETAPARGPGAAGQQAEGKLEIEMTTATRRLTEATIFWDSQDPTNEQWISRLKFDDGDVRIGKWDREIKERDGGLADAVIDLVYESTSEKLDLESGDIAIDGLCGTWARPDDETMTATTRRVIIEAADDTHDWDSDYVGNETLTLAEARVHIEELTRRAKADPEDADQAPDGVSWHGWAFRIRTQDEDGCYCVDVD